MSKLLLMFAVLLAAAMAGCQVVAAALDKIQGDPVVPAMYVPRQDNMLVLVEDYQNPALIEETAERIDWLTANELIAGKAAPIINPGRLTALRTSDPQAYRKMKIPEIGARLHAAQVLYVDVTDFSVQSAMGTEVLRAHAEARVKIVDVASGKTRWPRDATAAGYPLVIDLPVSPDEPNRGEIAVRTALAQTLASRMARLFYNATIEYNNPAPKYPESDSQYSQ